MSGFEQIIAIEEMTKSINNLIDYLKKNNEKANKHEFNHILDAFKEKSYWPSFDPKDSPYNEFECIICGWKFLAIIYGGLNNFEDPYGNVKKRALEHLAFKHNIGVQLYHER